MDLKLICLVLALCVASCLARRKKKPILIQDCVDSSNPAVKLTSSSLSPDYIPLPGKLSISGSVKITEPLAGRDLKLKLTIHKKVGFAWIKIPCLKKVGSCTYDLCDLLPKIIPAGDCPTEVTDLGLGCRCDTVVPGEYSLSDLSVVLPEVNLLPKGRYAVKGNLVDASTNEQEACIYVETDVRNGN